MDGNKSHLGVIGLCGELQEIEQVYSEHAAVKDILVFSDRLGQFVALVISEEASEDELQRVLDEVARNRLHDCARIKEFVSLHPDDPLIPALFTEAGSPHRKLIWELLVGCIDELTTSGHRWSPTCELLPPARAGEAGTHDPRDVQPRRGAPDVHHH